jgi:asparagine synthase (glutamine-hydrolysing)
MCGIAGIVGGDAWVRRAAVEEMTESMTRRGPDAGRVMESSGATFGHRRLAIFDLSEAGAQPMSTADGRAWVVFNGAIYNFKALRSELKKLGCRFHSESDTEVLLHGYRAWGIRGLVPRLRGMFAFALWDEPARTLYLVRDRLGVKPLVFAARGGELAFASTVRALKRAGYGGEIDERALLDLLRWGFIGEEHCIYRSLQKLPPATILEWCDGKHEQYRYWHAPRARSATRLSFADTVDQVEERLREAVAIRLNADVPVAALLSAGIDSGLICWAIAQSSAPVTAYTIGVPGHAWDESAAAEKTAQRLGIRHEVLRLTDGQIPDVEELLSAYDEPFPCSSALGMLCISRAVRSSAKVVLTGDGGDDLFLGYPRHRHLWLAERIGAFLNPSLTTVWDRWGGRRMGRGLLRRAGSLIDYASAGLDAFLEKSSDMARYRHKGLLGPRLGVAAAVRREDAAPRRQMVDKLVEFERAGRLVSEYLKKVDGATMHYGLEARAPFLDQELWEFAGALPVDLRLHRGELKAVLRALARRHLGWGISARKKRGFRIPAQRWLATHWSEHAHHILNNSVLAQYGWIDRANVLAELRGAVRLGRASEELWTVFVVEAWLQHEAREQHRPIGSLPRRHESLAAQGELC